MSHNDKLQELLAAKDAALLRALTEDTVRDILVVRDWLGNGGKLGYKGLADKYRLTEKQARTVCKNWKRAQIGQA